MDRRSLELELVLPRPMQESLSVVLISRNQRWNIDRLIASVQTETHHWQNEILLVDSASQDGTAEVASEIGILVVRLDPDQHLSPSVGRYVGFEMTSGEYVLFLDGDAQLIEGWLQLGVAMMKSQPEVGAITGTRVDLPVVTIPENQPNSPRFESNVEEVKRCGGSALYRRSALNLVGQFDPFLYSEEEPELALRLRDSGFKILRTTYPIIYNYTDAPDRIRTVLARRRRRLYLGTGQVLRKHWGRKTLRLYARDRRLTLLSLGGGLLLTMVSVWAFAAGAWTVLALCTLFPILVVFAVGVRRRSIPAALKSAIRELCHIEGLLRGLMKAPRFASLDHFRYVVLQPPNGKIHPSSSHRVGPIEGTEADRNAPTADEVKGD